MNRVIFLVDSFNLYHSIQEAYHFEKLRLKWLNIRSLCISYLPLINKDATLANIYYFSAFAYHLNDLNIIERHKNYVKCLESTGVIPEMGRFKPKDIKCPLGGKFRKHQEKETDIAIAVKLFEIVFKNECDTAVLMTGDTDLVPAIKTFKKLFPSKTILFAFPYRRWNSDLESLAPKSFKIHARSYGDHQFPDPFTFSDGTIIPKPSSW